MTKKELIDHLQHLEKYTHYSEDAPALREVIEMLKCSEMPNDWKKRTEERTEAHACDLISRQAAIEVIDAVFPVDPLKSEYAQGIACGAALAKTYVEQLPSAQPDLSEYSDKLWRSAYERGKRDAQPEIIRCKDCKHNPKDTWFGCPMAHCSETQRPETAWCWKGERREE
jgi:hypothetical protein